MAQCPEHAPGEAAPAGGTYELLNIFGSKTGIRVDVKHGKPLPLAPHSHSWILVRDNENEC